MKTTGALARGVGARLIMGLNLVADQPALDATEARDYWATGEPHDKAGGYAIQGGAAIFVADLKGSYSGVMGLPLFETAELLEQAGVPHWSYPR